MILDSPSKMVQLWNKAVATSNWFDPEKEAMVVFNLNTKLGVKNWQMVSVGTINECSVTPREILRSAVASLAYGVVIMHNHPSGNPVPSPADLEMTRRVRDGGKTLAIKTLDHIIVGDGKNGNAEFYSFREAGYL
jgi:DNA repair protein RadC